MYVSHKLTVRCMRFMLSVFALVLLTGKVIDKTNLPLMGVSVMVEGTRTGAATELDGSFSINAPANAVLVFSAIGMKTERVPINNTTIINLTMEEDALLLDQIVVTALGIKKERKALGYAVSDIKSEELMRNKTANPISSLSGKIAGVNITQSSGAAGSGAQIILRGGTSGSEGKDNQPLFVVDGVIYVNINSKFSTSWVKSLPEVQTEFNRGYMDDQYDNSRNYLGTVFNDFSYNSWGEKSTAKTYDNIGNFLQGGAIYDQSASVAGGTKNSNFYLSGSYYDQVGIVPETGYDKYTFRFNGEQRVGIFTFNANAAYSQAHTDRTLTGAALYGSQGTGALYGVYNWSPFDDMSNYLNEDGTRYRMFGDRLDPWEERDNPYWIVNKNKMFDDTDRFTGSLGVKADITDWWFVQYRLGIDSYTQINSNRIAANGVIKQVWQNGMMSG